MHLFASQLLGSLWIPSDLNNNNNNHNNYNNNNYNNYIQSSGQPRMASKNSFKICFCGSDDPSRENADTVNHISEGSAPD